MMGYCKIAVKLLSDSICLMLSVEGIMAFKMALESPANEKKEIKKKPAKGKKVPPTKKTPPSKGMGSPMGQLFLQGMLAKKGLKA